MVTFYFQPILVAIFVTIAKVKVKFIRDFYTWVIDLNNQYEEFGCVHQAGFPQALEIMENLENHQKSSMHGKIIKDLSFDEMVGA